MKSSLDIGKKKKNCIGDEEYSEIELGEWYSR